MKSKIKLCLALNTLVIFNLVTCTGRPPRNTFVTYMQSEPGRLDPFYSTDVVSGRVLAMLCDGLFRLDKDGRLQPDLLESYTFDGQTLHGRLHPNVRFHHGGMLTGKDVAFSLLRLRDSENPTSPRRSAFTIISSINTNEPLDITISLTQPSPTWLYQLALPSALIISSESYQRDGSIVGSGPFMLEEWKTDERIIVKANPQHRNPPEVDKVMFRIVPEELSARFEFMNGTLDYYEISYLARASLGNTSYRSLTVPEYSVYYIALNNRDTKLSNIRLRQALNMAVDREAIRRMLFRDRFVSATGPVPPGMGGYSTATSGYAYKPEAARQIFTELGASGREFELLIKADHQVELMAQMIQHYLQQAGLKVRIRSLEWTALRAITLSGNYDMALFTWHADYPEPENFLWPLFHSTNAGAGGNRAFYTNPETDALLEAARTEADPGKRFDIYRQAEKLIVHDAPWIFLWHGDKRIALSPRVAAFVPYPTYSGLKGNEIRLVTTEGSP